MKLKNFIPGLIFLLIAMLLVYVNDLEEKPNFYPTMVSKDIPVFTMESLDGKLVSNTDMYGKIVNVWASWCVACKAEHGSFLSLKEQGYQMIGINSADTKDRALTYLENYKNPFSDNINDPKRTLAIALGVTGMPETFVIDKQGMIIFHRRGVITDDIINTQIKPLLEKMN